VLVGVPAHRLRPGRWRAGGLPGGRAVPTLGTSGV